MRHGNDPQGAARVARGPGKILREAREAAGFSLDEMARRTRLQPRVIEAVEADAYEQLAGTGFVKGYIRLMAREVRLDPALPLAEFDLQFSATEPSIADFQSSPPAELTAGNRWIKATSVGLLLVLMALVVAWWEHHRGDAAAPEGEAPQAVTEEQPEPGTPLPYAFTIVEHSTAPLEAPANWRRQSDGSAPPAETSPPAAQTSTEAAPASRAEKPAADKPAAPRRAEGENADARPPSGAADARQEAPVEPASEQGGAKTPAKREAPRDAVAEEDRPKPARAADSPDLVLHAARNESWVEITDRAGEKLWTGTVKRGGRIGVTGKPPYSVVIGNARDVDVTWRQRPVKLERTIQNGTARGSIGEPD